MVCDLYDRTGIPVPFFGKPARTQAIAAMIARRLGTSLIGFGRGELDAVEAHEAEMKERARLLKHVEPHDLVEFGMIPEFVGRLPVVTTLDPLSRDDLVRVMKERMQTGLRGTRIPQVKSNEVARFVLSQNLLALGPSVVSNAITPDTSGVS